MHKSTITKLNDMGACSDAVAWLKKQDRFEQAWADCKRGDWMLWLLGKLSGAPDSDERKRVVAVACGCARLSLPFAKSPAVLSCIETTERWTRGEATIEEVRDARPAAYAAAYAAAAAAYAADAAAYAYAAAYAAAAAYAYAAADAAADAARKETLAQCADIVRAHYPIAPVLP